MSATAASRTVPLASVAAVRSELVRNGVGPLCDVLIGHPYAGIAAGVVVAPVLDVDQELRARQQRSLAHALGWRRRRELAPQPSRQLLHDLLRDLVALARIHEPEQDEVDVEHTVVLGPEAAQQAFPVEL